MASTYTLISSNVLGSTTASVTFSSIPSTYTDLILRCSARDNSTLSTQASFVDVQINSSTTNYSVTRLYTDGSTVTSTRPSYTKIKLFGETGGSFTANTFGSSELYIPSYTVAQNKPMSGIGVAEQNAATTTYIIGATAQLWSDTSAITSLTLTPDDGTAFVSGSSFYLYGIKSS